MASSTASMDVRASRRGAMVPFARASRALHAASCPCSSSMVARATIVAAGRRHLRLQRGDALLQDAFGIILLREEGAVVVPSCPVAAR